MITRPSTAQLLEVVRRELAEQVRPALSDPQVITSLQMIDHILSTLAVRADHELGWMFEEIEEIEGLGERFVTSRLSGSAQVGEALEFLRAAANSDVSTAGITERYNRATEVLSRVLEATFGDGGALEREALALLDRRLDHEVAVIGPDFQLVGRH